MLFVVIAGIEPGLKAVWARHRESTLDAGLAFGGVAAAAQAATASALKITWSAGMGRPNR